MRNGECSARATSELATDGIVFGSCLATPTATANQFSPTMQKWSGCRAWSEPLPTPMARDYKGPVRDWSKRKRNGKPRPRSDQTLPDRIGGMPNPPWIEWLMGWPIGWTALEPLETGKFRLWLRAFSSFSRLVSGS